jgi:hypothetical protein
MADKEISPFDDARLIGQAVANTESEIFRETTGLADPEDVEEGFQPDRNREDMGDGLEGQVEDPEPAEGDEDAAEGDEGEDPPGDEADEAAEIVPADDAPVVPEPPQRTRVPVGELLTERKARQAAEERATAAESKAERDLAAMNQRIDALLQGQQQRPAEQAQQPAAPTKPDQFADPEGYEAWLRADIAKVYDTRRLEDSLQSAHATHGAAFAKAYQDLTGNNPADRNDRTVRGLDLSDPVNRATIDRIKQSYNPGQAIMTWHAQQQAIRDGGTSAFREKVEAETRAKLMADPEVRKQILADLRAEASGANGGRPRTIARAGTRSLNDVSGGTSQTDELRSPDDSEEGVFGDVWKNG